MLAHANEATAAFAWEREEATCLWVKPYLTRFLKSAQQVLSIIGKPGAGKSVLSSVINDHLQNPVGGMRYTSILAPISQSCHPTIPMLCACLPHSHLDSLTSLARWSDPGQYDPARRSQDDLVAIV